MRTLLVPYISKLAIALLLFLFPAPSTAQNTPPTNSLPLEVRSPYFNFWTPVSDAALSDVQYITQAVRHEISFRVGHLFLTCRDVSCFLFLPILLVPWSHSFGSD
jgi:hypothetical protein